MIDGLAEKMFAAAERERVLHDHSWSGHGPHYRGPTERLFATLPTSERAQWEAAARAAVEFLKPAGAL